jgi:hypothetical protein
MSSVSVSHCMLQNCKAHVNENMGQRRTELDSPFFPHGVGLNPLGTVATVWPTVPAP